MLDVMWQAAGWSCAPPVEVATADPSRGSAESARPCNASALQTRWERHQAPLAISCAMANLNPRGLVRTAPPTVSSEAHVCVLSPSPLNSRHQYACCSREPRQGEFLRYMHARLAGYSWVPPPQASQRHTTMPGNVFERILCGLASTRMGTRSGIVGTVTPIAIRGSHRHHRPRNIPV